MTLYIDPATFFMPLLLWAVFIGVIIAGVLVLDRDWQIVPAFLVRRFLWAGLFIGLVCTRLSATDVFIECDWDTLVGYYGEAMAWVFWIMGGC